MKRVFAVLITTVLLMCMCSVGASAAKKGYVANDHEALNLRNAIANVQRVNGEDALTLVESGDAPGIVYVKASELDDTQAFFEACLEHDVLPVVSVQDDAEAHAVNKARKAASFDDLTVVSSSAEALTFIRESHPKIRTGLTCDLKSDKLTSKEANAVRKTVRSAPATFCVIDSADAGYQAVSELQELAVAVWVEVKSTASSASFTAEALRALTSGANGIITDDAAALAKVVNTYFEKNTMTRTPIMIGHRGNPTQAPENTLSGFIAAYENGADVFEIDVEITKDGEVIIMHDDSLNRTTNYDGKKTVGEMTLKEIKTYKILDGKTVTDETVPTLREVLEEFKDKDIRIFVEFKGYKIENVKATAKLIKEYDMEDRVDVISFSPNLIAETHQQLPGVSTGYLHSASGRASSQAEALKALQTSVSTAQQCESSVNPNKSVMSTHFMQAATDRGITVWPWTYNNSSNATVFLQCPDGVTTDDVQWSETVVKYLEVSASKTVAPGTAMDCKVSAVMYGGDKKAVSADDVIVKVIEGGDNITVDGTTVKGVKNGKATVMFGYKTRADKAGMYVLYTQPVTITVANAPVNAAAQVDGGVDVLMIVAVVLCVVAVAVVVVIVVLLAKGKKKTDI